MKRILNLVVVVAVLVAVAGTIELAISSGAAQEDKCPDPPFPLPFTQACTLPDVKKQEDCDLTKLLDKYGRSIIDKCRKIVQLEELCAGVYPIRGLARYRCDQDPKCTTTGARCFGVLDYTSLQWSAKWYTDDPGVCYLEVEYDCDCECGNITGVPCVPGSDSSLPVRAVSMIAIGLPVAALAFALRKRILSRER